MSRPAPIASLSDFDIPEIAEAVRGGAQGLREIARGGRKLMVAFVRLDVLGWFYVVEADAASLQPTSACRSTIACGWTIAEVSDDGL